jgi:hypothetical protein
MHLPKTIPTDMIFNERSFSKGRLSFEANP